MELPSKDDLVWGKLISGEKKVDFSHLGLKVCLGRLKLKSSGSIESKIEEFYNVFKENINNSKIQEDLSKVIN